MPRIVSYTELKPRFGIRWTRKHIIELIRAGRFPHPVHLGGQTIGWPEDEIDDWLKARIAERDAPPEKPTPHKRLASKQHGRKIKDELAKLKQLSAENNEVTT